MSRDIGYLLESVNRARIYIIFVGDKKGEIEFKKKRDYVENALSVIRDRRRPSQFMSFDSELELEFYIYIYVFLIYTYILDYASVEQELREPRDQRKLPGRENKGFNKNVKYKVATGNGHFGNKLMLRRN